MAVAECGAPVVAVAGGQPLLHKELPRIVQASTAQKKFVYLCKLKPAGLTASMDSSAVDTTVLDERDATVLQIIACQPSS